MQMLLNVQTMTHIALLGTHLSCKSALLCEENSPKYNLTESPFKIRCVHPWIKPLKTYQFSTCRVMGLTGKKQKLYSITLRYLSNTIISINKYKLLLPQISLHKMNPIDVVSVFSEHFLGLWRGLKGVSVSPHTIYAHALKS